MIAIYDASTNEKYNFSILKGYKGKIIYVANKVDKVIRKNIINKSHIQISAKYNQGIDEIVNIIISIIKENFSSSSNCLITRIRYRKALEECLDNLETFSLDKEIELAAEDLRLACRAIGKITGNVEVDEILDKIFGSFCIGK